MNAPNKQVLEIFHFMVKMVQLGHISTPGSFYLKFKSQMEKFPNMFISAFFFLFIGF